MTALKNANPTAALADLDQLARQWGARHIPFAGSPSWLQTPGVRNAWSGLDRGARLRQTLLLSGPNGVGKSALARQWIEKLDRRLFVPVVVTQATLSGSSILAAISMKLGGPPGGRRERLLQNIEQALGELEPRIPVVLLDEAQNYSHGALEEIQLLLGLNLPAQPAFALVLIGDEFLIRSMGLRHHRALYSRLSAHLTLQRWTPAEATDFIRTGLESAGLAANSIEDTALADLVRASGGLARSLELLARQAWIHAASAQATTIGAEHVDQAIQGVPFVPGLHEPPQTLNSPSPAEA